MTDRTVLSVRRLRPDAQLPQRMTQDAAGYDLRAVSEVVLRPGERALVPTGLAIQLPPGTQGEVRPRSGLAWRTGVTILNSPGTIDADYRGELQIALVNLGQEVVRLAAGERVAQLVVMPVIHPVVVEVSELETTPRGEGGFGHTGRV